MDLGNFAEKAKDAVRNNRDKIEEQTDKLIDSKLEGDKADKAREMRDKGLDALGN